MKIELAYCLPEKQMVLSLEIENNCTAKEAIEQSGLLQRLSLGKVENLEIGVFGKKIGLEAKLYANDRIEIYRPLLLSPTEARRLRAKTLDTKILKPASAKITA